MQVAMDRVFADHYQFYIFDSLHDHASDAQLNSSGGGKLPFGYLASERAIYVSTVAHLNTHRVRVFIDELPSQEYERTFVTRLLVDGSGVTLSAPACPPEEELTIPIAPGAYRVHVCSRNIGIDELDVLPEGAEELSDEEFLIREDIEYYDIFFNRD